MFSRMILHLRPPHPTSVVEKSDKLHLKGFVFGKKSTLSKRRCNKRAFSFYLIWTLHNARETSSSVDGCTLAAWPHLGWIGLCNCHLCCISYWDLQWAGYHTVKYAESTIFGPLSSENSKWSQCILRTKKHLPCQVVFTEQSYKCVSALSVRAHIVLPEETKEQCCGRGHDVFLVIIHFEECVLHF